MAVGDTYNNPGDLKSLGGGQTWQGQTGTYGLSGASGSFVSFDSMADGVRATAVDLTNAINEGYNTVQSLVYHFLGTSSNNQENPHVQNYLSAVEQGSGLTGSVSASDVPALVQGIFKGEGTASGVSSSALSQGLGMAGYSGTAFAGNEAGDAGFNSGFVNSDRSQAINTIAANSSGQSLISVGSATSAGTPTASSHGAGTGASANTGLLAMLSQLLTTWDSTSFVTRAVLVILGVLLLAAAFFAFTKQSININPADLAAAAA